MSRSIGILFRTCIPST